LLFTNASQTWQGTATEDDQEDGVLTAYELGNLDLSHTHLAVLSACETGMGDILNGEGVYGLQRAMKQAGVQKMIVSLWPVPDKETSEMMQLFYQQISEGISIATSFRKAQENMRKKYPSAPALWGAFSLIE
jgi:CHAT domain-containing protein